MSEQFAVDFALPPSKLLKKVLFVVRQAHHERKEFFSNLLDSQCRKNPSMLSLCAETAYKGAHEDPNKT